ncbi:MAG: hypothetical protein COB49_02125 [Alphaproteobacteria bacterium]|nr:MAG: hypothetical protein COB49_02125 [Alphaproteobacteria bacterium]
MSGPDLMCANHGCPSAAACARFTTQPHLGHVFPFAKGSETFSRVDFVPDRRGKCPQFAKRKHPSVTAKSPHPNPLPRGEGEQGRLI